MSWGWEQAVMGCVTEKNIPFRLFLCPPNPQLLSTATRQVKLSIRQNHCAHIWHWLYWFLCFSPFRKWILLFLHLTLWTACFLTVMTHRAMQDCPNDNRYLSRLKDFSRCKWIDIIFVHSALFPSLHEKQRCFNSFGYPISYRLCF